MIVLANDLARKHFSDVAIRAALEADDQVLIDMPIEDFLKMALPLVNPDQRKLREASDRLANDQVFSSIPVLDIDIQEEEGSTPVGVVLSHDGRHRGLALQQSGYTRMPVSIRYHGFRNYKKVNLWPDRMRSQDGNYYIPMPVQRNIAGWYAAV